MAAQRLSKLQKKILLILREAPDHKLHRSKLLFKVYDWQKYDLYLEKSYRAAIDRRKFWVEIDNGIKLDSKGIPPGYKSKQASFTRALKLLQKNDFVVLLSKWEEPINTNREFNREASLKEGLENEKKRYLKEKQDGKTKEADFDHWFTRRRPIVIFGMATGGWNTRESVWRSNYGHRWGRNIGYTKLTTKGIDKALSVLKVKYNIRQQ